MGKDCFIRKTNDRANKDNRKSCFNDNVLSLLRRLKLLGRLLISKMPDYLLCVTSIGLGLRHGLDIDHVAAIADMVGGRFAPGVQHSSRLRSCQLALTYSAGHGLVVIVLGVSALVFKTMLPAWINPLMEKLVGITLVALGLWVLYLATSRKTTCQSSVIRSRGMMLLVALLRCKHWVSMRIFRHAPELHSNFEYDFCDWKCAASIGVLHGIGAETGTQILLLSSVGALNDSTTGFVLMGGFLIGMFACQLILALVATESYLRVQSSSKWLEMINVIVAIASIVTGIIFIAGAST